MREAGREKDLTVINPSGILGPLLDDDPGTSSVLIARLIRPVSIGIVASEDDRGPVAAKAPADAVAGAPSSYGDVPRLGAPLPGDLGRPILEHQRATGMVPVDPAADAAAQEAEAERQRGLPRRGARRVNRA